MGISGETTVFERMSVGILGQEVMCNKGNDLRHVLIHLVHDQKGMKRTCLFVSKKYLHHFSFDDLNGVTNSISFN